MMHNLLIWDQKLNQSDCCRSRIFFAGVVRNICCDFETMGVMCVVVGLQIVREGEGDGCCVLQYPRCYSTVPRVLFTGWIAAAARVGGAGNTGRGASPTAGKREGISF